MEDHFERVLSADIAPKRPAATSPLAQPKKRNRILKEVEPNVKAIVDGAEAHTDDTIDARALKSMVNSLDKHVRRNALAREKYADDPSKFLESEMALDSELSRWKKVAAKPELFAEMTKLQVPRVLLGLFSHENIDVRLSVLSLLADLTDVDAAASSLGPARMLARNLVDEKLLPLLVTNLNQLAKAVGSENSEQAEEEKMGIYNSLQILENMADLEPQVCGQVAETPIYSFLLDQVAPKKVFSENKLYASEILSIMLQSGAKSREKFVSWIGKIKQTDEQREARNTKVYLMDDLLQALAPYRKKDPSSEEEKEFVCNLVNALCSVLLVSEAQTQFRYLEGLELLLRFMKDRKRFIFGEALRAMDHALMGNKRNCERLIEIGGLRSVFSAFMGRLGKYKTGNSSKASKASDKAKEEENAASIVASMCAWVCEKAPADGYDRLHAKFVENEMEKVDRLVDLFVKYHARVENSDFDMDIEETKDKENRYFQRLDAGLFVLERIAFVVAHLCCFSRKVCAYVMVKFHERSVESNDLVAILREQLDLLIADDVVKPEIKEDGLEVATDVINDQIKESQMAQLRKLVEMLEAKDILLTNENDDAIKPSETPTLDEQNTLLKEDEMSDSYKPTPLSSRSEEMF
ncbi:hypothetical protein CCR75_000775 [Bremia lactucae]|uniref:Beta-catenin-like protein 1 N-terminal domain-containing protein n=1 Tax=Bremia lactucae TaxID=4779 RepID=A0A976II04_BRELC|nr:hypothetical protein CCR75_000775 [Bremia lactucae]